MSQQNINVFRYLIPENMYKPILVKGGDENNKTLQVMKYL